MKITITFFLLHCIVACGQESSATDALTKPIVNEQVTSNIEETIPPGYEIANTGQGQELIYRDLNGDGKTDAVVLLVMEGDPSYDQVEEVLLAIFTADRHGQFQMSATSKNMGGESLLYSQTKSLSVNKNVINYFHQSMRHDMNLKFRYDKNVSDFMLIGKDYNEYGGMEDGPRHISINYLTGVKLINESTWDDQLEEAVEQPQRKETFNKDLQTLGEINWEKIYDDL